MKDKSRAMNLLNNGDSVIAVSKDLGVLRETMYQLKGSGVKILDLKLLELKQNWPARAKFGQPHCKSPRGELNNDRVGDGRLWCAYAVSRNLLHFSEGTVCEIMMPHLTICKVYSSRTSEKIFLPALYEHPLNNKHYNEWYTFKKKNKKAIQWAVG